MNKERQNFLIDSKTSEVSRKRDSSDQQKMHIPRKSIKRPISEVCDISDQIISNNNKKGVTSLDCPMDIRTKSSKSDSQKLNLMHNDLEFDNIFGLHSLNQERKNIPNYTENARSNMNIPQMYTDGNVAQIGEFKVNQDFSLPNIATVRRPSYIREYDCNSNMNIPQMNTDGNVAQTGEFKANQDFSLPNVATFCRPSYIREYDCNSNLNIPQMNTDGNVAHTGEFKTIQDFPLPNIVSLRRSSYICEYDCLTNKNISQENSDSIVANTEEFKGNQEYSLTHIRTLTGPSYIRENDCHSNINVSKINMDGIVAQIGEFKGIRDFTVPDAATLTGPSFNHKNISNCNLSTEIVKMTSPAKLHRLEKKPSMFLSFKNKDVSEPSEINVRRTILKCSICNYSTDNNDFFKYHMDYHSTNPFFCNACRGCYADENVHFTEIACNVCNYYFECKGLLENHYISHEDDHLIKCRICQNEIDNHASKGEDGKKVYQCCEAQCFHKTKDWSNFRKHLYKHSYLKLFKCHRCGRQYNLKNSLSKHLRKRKC